MWVIMIVDFIIHAVAGDEGSVAMLLMYIASVVVSAFIAWFAWTWPKQEA